MDGDLRGARGIALIVRFLLELALLAGAAAASFLLLPDPWRWISMVLVPVAIAVLWGLTLSPRRRIDLGGAGRVLVEALLFGGVALALAGAEWLVPALVGFALWALDRIALAVLPEPTR